MARGEPCAVAPPVRAEASSDEGRRRMSDIDLLPEPGQSHDPPPDWRLTRRTFLKGCAVVAAATATIGGLESG
jgi:hypothetical protein